MISMIEFYQCWGIIGPHEEQEWLGADNERHHENQEGSAHTMCLQHLWGYIFKKLTTNKCCAWEEIFSKEKIKLEKNTVSNGTCLTKILRKNCFQFKNKCKIWNPPKHTGVLWQSQLVLLCSALLCFTATAFLNKLNICGNATLSVCWHHFSDSICSFFISVSNLAILTLSSFSLWWYLLWWLVVFNVPIAQKRATCWRLRCWWAFFSNKVVFIKFI